MVERIYDISTDPMRDAWEAQQRDCSREVADTFTPAKVTPGNALGCVGIAAVSLAGPTLTILGHGRTRKAGIAITAIEAGVISLGLKVSQVLE